MKQGRKRVWCILCGVGLTLLIALVTSVGAFHEGGVGYCDGCHILHGSADASPQDPEGSALLKGSDPSSTCLGCHANLENPYSILNRTSPTQTAAGDFSWLEIVIEEGESGTKHGHNVIAVDFSLTADDNHLYAPGGDYPALGLQCISCHDPHGKIADGSNPDAISGSGSYGDTTPTDSMAGNFRLLGGEGYMDSSQSSGFLYAAPIAVAPKDVSPSESDFNHVAYGQGMSEWCANCHADMLYDASRPATDKHPAGSEAKLTREMITRYNSYVSTGDMSGNYLEAYSALVPFEVGSDDLNQLDPGSTSGPGVTANVMCLTCHRAHASAYDNIGRWDFRVTLLASSYLPEAYYGQVTNTYQRQLCGKCHPY